MVCFSDHENQLLQRILIDPAIAEGRPTLRDTRLAVCRVLRHVAEGRATDAILLRYPGLTPEDIDACILCGRVMHIPGSGGY